MLPYVMPSVTPFYGTYSYIPTFSYNFSSPFLWNFSAYNTNAAGGYSIWNTIPRTSSGTGFFSRILDNLLKPVRNIQAKYRNNSNSGTSQSAISTGYNSQAISKIRNSNLMKNVPAQTKAKILDAVDRACKQYNVDPKLLISMMYAESKFNPNAQGPYIKKLGERAKGLMQFTSAAAKQYGVKNPFDIEQSIFGAAKFLQVLSKKYNGRRDLMAAAYNAGPGNVKNCVPNFKETKKYVAEINETYRQLA